MQAKGSERDDAYCSLGQLQHLCSGPFYTLPAGSFVDRAVNSGSRCVEFETTQL
jgi:hypothetical protein